MDKAYWNKADAAFALLCDAMMVMASMAGFLTLHLCS